MEELSNFPWHTHFIIRFPLPDRNNRMNCISKLYDDMSDRGIMYCLDAEEHRVLLSIFFPMHSRASCVIRDLYWMCMHDGHVREKYGTKESNTGRDVSIKELHGLSRSSCDGLSTLRKDLLHILATVILWYRVFLAMSHHLHMSPTFRALIVIYSYTLREFSESHTDSKEKCSDDE